MPTWQKLPRLSLSGNDHSRFHLVDGEGTVVVRVEQDEHVLEVLKAYAVTDSISSCDDPYVRHLRAIFSPQVAPSARAVLSCTNANRSDHRRIRTRRGLQTGYAI